MAVPVNRASAMDADAMQALIGIRFPLALWVVVHHLTGPKRMFDPLVDASPVARTVVDAAWVALNVFFAISGFVLARRYGAVGWTRETLGRYLVARAGRIYPVYFFSLLVLVPVIVEALRGDTLGTTLDRTRLVAAHVLLLQGWGQPVVNWNTPAWSLTCEGFFYACFPLIALLLRPGSPPRLLAMAGLAFAVPIALRLSLEPPIAKPLLYVGDFLIGVVAAEVYGRIEPRRSSTPALGSWLAGGAIVAGLALLVFQDALGSFLVFDAGSRLVCAVLVIGLAWGGGPLIRALSSRAMLAGGRASYAIYLLHIPVLWIYERSELRAALPPVPAGVIFLAFIVWMSFIVNRHYEDPANDIIRAAYARWTGRPGTDVAARPRVTGGAEGPAIPRVESS
jgi:peptidoglycan/LPS O-acetylase OafA/YrhL